MYSYMYNSLILYSYIYINEYTSYTHSYMQVLECFVLESL